MGIIAHTIPTHGMCCFKLLATIFDEISSPINKFWWGEKKDERKIHQINWKGYANQSNKKEWGLWNVKKIKIKIKMVSQPRLKTNA